jgi:hypothetical protein
VKPLSFAAAPTLALVLPPDAEDAAVLARASRGAQHSAHSSSSAAAAAPAARRLLGMRRAASAPLTARSGEKALAREEMGWTAVEPQVSPVQSACDFSSGTVAARRAWSAQLDAMATRGVLATPADVHAWMRDELSTEVELSRPTLWAAGRSSSTSWARRCCAT